MAARSTKTFEKMYAKLNAEQRRAVDAIEGPVMVIAGPGTGKTQILTLRIANILLRTDAQAESILALTFTESGAAEMRKRLVSIIGTEAYAITIGTFHSFCNDLISRYPENFPRIVGARPASEVEQIRVVESILATGGFEYLRPYGDVLYYVRPILGAIRTLKREGIDPEGFERKLVEEQNFFDTIPDLYHERGAHKGTMKGVHADALKQIEKNKELLAVYRGYEAELEKARRYDYEDMIVETIRVLEGNEDFLRELQEEYQYILADEHQDTNNAQNRVLELLARFHERPNVFIVGDEKQAIFRFQGASLNNFLYFQNRFQDVELVVLEENYRSTQPILDAAGELIKNNPVPDERLRKRLGAHNKKGGKKVVVEEYRNEESEAIGVASALQTLIEKGVDPAQIAILYRTNADSERFSDVLAKKGIPFTIESDKDLLADPDIRKFIVLLRAVNDLGDDELLSRALHIDFLGIDPLDVYKLVATAERTKHPLSEALVRAPAFRGIGKKLKSWKTLAENTTVLELVDTVVSESGFLDALLSSPRAHERLAVLEAFVREVRARVESEGGRTLSHFVEHLNVLAQYAVRVRVQAGQRDGARLMTAHRAKGLEFDHVFIVRAVDGNWGGRRSRALFRLQNDDIGFSAEGDDADERRLFYVALTRARRGVVVSFAREGALGRTLLPSRFIDEIAPRYRTHAVVPERSFVREAHEAFAPRRQIGKGLADFDYLRTRFLDQGLSVTALNNYLECPWKYFYNNLIRIPRTHTTAQLYGLAVHDALRRFFDKLAKGEKPRKTFLKEAFQEALAQQPLAEGDRRRFQKRGERALGGYVDTYRKKWHTKLLNELRIGDARFSFAAGEGTDTIPLTGMLDKVELYEDNRVNVVDYKTGKPKSRNWIEGNVKNSDGAYFRQLVFYRLLLDQHKAGKYRMETGELDFVEPSERGTYKKERFAISQNDVDSLEKTLSEVTAEINAFSFWNKRCGDSACEYCGLRNLLSDK